MAEETCKEIYIEDYYEKIGHYVLTRTANEALTAMRQCPYLSKKRLYGFDELYQASKLCGLRRTKFGQGSLGNDLNNLWRCGKIRKFAEDFYVRTGRPYGIKWWIHES